MKSWLSALLLLAAGTTAMAADMLLGPGDVVRISVYGSPDLMLETRISDGGKISYPLIGDVDVRDLSIAQAQARIAGLLSSGGFVKRPQVNMVVTSVQSQQVSVLGYVGRPGRYPMEGRRTLIDMLALAGGISIDGAETVTVVRVVNGVSTRTTVDVAEIVKANALAKNLELRAGDVVYVDHAQRFYIYGEVQRAGVYRLERNMTVVQALSTGGGLTARGTERGIQIRRRGTDGKVKVISPSLDDLVEFEDVVQVKESLF